MNDEYPVVAKVLLDPLPTATMVETVVGEYLIAPEPGIYFRGKPTPLMRPGVVYHQHRMAGGRKSKETFVVATIEDIERHFPVMDLDANIVVMPNQIPFLTYHPVLPVVALRIVKTAVLDILDRYGSSPDRAPTERIFERQLFEQYINPNLQLGDLTSICDQITGIVAEIRTKVMHFCGDDRWVMHFFNEAHGAFVIEKSVDWRILEYHRMTRTRYAK
jgi:hypothetical protein